MVPSRKIIHIDMDCFYAAVEAKHHPELRGKALGIGGPANSRGVLCTASYEARKFGVRSAMPSSQAVRLCPHLILRPPNFELYKKESAAVREIFSRFTDKIEPLSLDEAYLDVTDSPHLHGSATFIAREIRACIQRELGLTASAGVAPNKFLAKVASDWNKPNGQFVIRPQEIESFVQELPVEKIHGVGKVTAEKLHALGFRRCADLLLGEKLLREKWGSRSDWLLNYARGLDDREVEPRSERKSLTVEETYARDIPTLEGCLARLPELYEDWERRMRRADLFSRIRGYVVKVKFFDFRGTTHEISAIHAPTPQNFADLMRAAWARRAQPVRLLGLGVRLAEAEPQQLRLAI